MTWYREWFGEEYLDLYAYRDEEEARQHVAFFKSQIGSIDGAVLDLACGGGRHIQEFIELGYRVIGCDLSLILLRNAREQPFHPDVVRADMRNLPFARSAFSGLVNFFTSFGYFETEVENARVIAEMCRVLTPGSPFLFDYLNVARELDRMVHREERETENGLVQIERWFDSASGTFNKRIKVGERRFLERVRGYNLDEISALFAANGFSIKDVYGDFNGGAFTPESPRLILIGKRRR